EEELQRLKGEQAQVKTEQLEMKKQAGLAVTASEVGRSIRRLPLAGFAPFYYPLSILEFGHDISLLVNYLRMLDIVYSDRLFGDSGFGHKLRHTINHVPHKMETIHVV